MASSGIRDIAQLLRASRDFFDTAVEAPTTNNLVSSIIARSARPDWTSAQIVAHANDTRVLVHARILPLLDAFLAFKRAHGSSRERNHYAFMSPTELVRCLIRFRPLAFYNSRDKSVLRDGTIPPGHDWELVGANREGSIKLGEYLSYDEIQVGALLGVSSPTYFINSGSRHNKGKIESEGSFEADGIIIDLVGARFQKVGRMETEHMIVSADWSRAEFGYGVDGADRNPVAALKLEVFAALYLLPSASVPRYYCPSYDEAADDESGRFHSLVNGSFFNIAAYKERIRLPMECLFVEADDRAEQAGKMAYVVVVGLGLERWRVCKEQQQWFLDVFREVFESVRLDHVADIDLSSFSWDDDTRMEAWHCYTNAFGNVIKFHYTRRSLADRFPPSDPPKLLVVSYTWDGNAFPGNEYWNGMLSSSEGSAASCCSTIVELQNAWINEGFVDRQHLIQPVIVQHDNTDDESSMHVTVQPEVDYEPELAKLRALLCTTVQCEDQTSELDESTVIVQPGNSTLSVGMAGAGYERFWSWASILSL